MEKKTFLLILILLSLGLWGCRGISKENVTLNTEQNESNQKTENVQTGEETLFTDFNDIAKCYQKVYEKAVSDGTLATIPVMKKIIECIGNLGYAAVDNANQVNMVNSEQVKKFINKVKEEKEGEVTIVSVSDCGGFTMFDLKTSNGEVSVIESYITWNGEKPEKNYEQKYNAYTFDYSKEGYLFFEQYHMPGYDGPSGHTALRVEYLDDKCRELNHQYLLPIGYGSNNMFITEWSEDDYGELNFYDLFHVLYPLVYHKQTPYEVSYEGELYDVAQEEFEKVIMSFFKTDSETLQSKTTYKKDARVYEYRTRGFNDWGWNPNTPYPEVEQYEENVDGTIKLIVNVVYPAENISCAFSHEVVIRPLTDGGVQYVSNQVIPSKKNMEPIWYKDKFTDEEWKELYGEQE